MNEIKKITLKNGVTLAYKEIGAGDKYLISTQNFFLTDCHMELLGKSPYDYHCFLIYMRGYGESDHIFDSTPKDYTKIWGQDVIDFAQAMNIPDFYYTGVSHGNWAGWYIAFHRPELIRGFVCCDGIAQYRPMSDRQPGMPVSGLDVEKLVGNQKALEAMAWMEHWPTKNPKRLARREANHREHTQILMNRKAEEFMICNNNMCACDVKSEKELYEKMSKIPFPTMILCGGLDPLATADKCLEVAQAIPGARLLVYQHLGHGGPDECPELIARDCDRFFKDTQERIL